MTRVRYSEFEVSREILDDDVESGDAVSICISTPQHYTFSHARKQSRIHLAGSPFRGLSPVASQRGGGPKPRPGTQMWIWLWSPDGSMGSLLSYRQTALSGIWPSLTRSTEAVGQEGTSSRGIGLRNLGLGPLASPSLLHEAGLVEQGAQAIYRPACWRTRSSACLWSLSAGRPAGLEPERRVVGNTTLE